MRYLYFDLYTSRAAASTVGAQVCQRLFRRDTMRLMSYASPSETKTVFDPYTVLGDVATLIEDALDAGRTLLVQGALDIEGDHVYRLSLRFRDDVSAHHPFRFIQGDAYWPDFAGDGWWKHHPILPSATYTVPAFPGRLVSAIDLLALRILGLDRVGQVDPSIERLYVCLDDNWFGPTGNAVVYYPKPEDVLREFASIYATTVWGVTPAQAFALGDVVWRLSPAQIADLPPGQVPLSKMKTFMFPLSNASEERIAQDGRWDEHLRFLEHLERDRAAQLATVSPPHARLLLQEALQRTPNVRTYAERNQGLLLAVDPPTTLWPLYAAIVGVANEQPPASMDDAM